MQIVAVRPQAPTVIRTDLGAIFVSLELSRSTWLITSLAPGGREKMSKHSVHGGDVAGLLEYHCNAAACFRLFGGYRAFPESSSGFHTTRRASLATQRGPVNNSTILPVSMGGGLSERIAESAEPELMGRPIDR
jgi:hypothetical protein